MTERIKRKILKRGVLIAIEGIDGSGKTTQVCLLIEHLKADGYDVVGLKEPTDGKWGEKIRQIKKTERGEITPQAEFELFMQDRYEDVLYNILPALEEDKVVIMDRYYYSTIAYQGALGIDTKVIQALNEEFAPRPNLVFFLHVPLKLGLSRIKKNRVEKDSYFEEEKYLNRVDEIFRSMEGDFIYHIDSSRPLKEVSSHIIRIVYNLLDSLSEK